MHYIKTAWRNLTRNKSIALINIGGLAIGMAVAMLIGIWIWDELSFNKSIPNYKSIAQVMSRGVFAGNASANVSMPRPLEFELRNKYGSSFKNIVLSRWTEEHILSSKDKNLMQNGRFMGPGVIDMLSLKMLSGNKKALEDPNSIILSTTAAEALFGKEQALGKTIKLDNKFEVAITGVYEDLPRNTEFSSVKFICPFDLLEKREPWVAEVRNNWHDYSFLLYVQLNPKTTIEAASSRIRTAIYNHLPADEKKFQIKTFLYPMSRWYLYSWKQGINVEGKMVFVKLFGIIGVFVLLLACINFINLSTARSEERAKEIGVRKTIGSSRTNLIQQFLCESFLVVVLAWLIALVLIFICRPWFGQLAAKQIVIPWSEPIFWFASISFVFVTGLISGSYPAFYLSSFNPIEALKDKMRLSSLSGMPRKVLVLIQFTVSVALITGTIIIYLQIEQARNRPVGYNKENLLAIPIVAPEIAEKAEVISTELKRTGMVTETALSFSPLTNIWSESGFFDWEGKTADQLQNIGIMHVTHNFGKTCEWKLLAGRDFSPSIPADSLSSHSEGGIVRSIIINQTLANYMKLHNPIGSIIKWEGHPFKIIGVIADQIMNSPYRNPMPTVYLVNFEVANRWFYLRTNPNLSAHKIRTGVEAVFKKIVPNAPPNYSFADEEYDQFFVPQTQIGKLAFVFALLTIFISCLGLFGLASYTVSKRGKEMSIRKVLGASAFSIWNKLSLEFTVLVTLACFIAFPLSNHLMKLWLENFDLHISISWWIFLLSGTLALVIALGTVSFQALKAARVKPAQRLRSE